VQAAEVHPLPLGKAARAVPGARHGTVVAGEFTVGVVVEVVGDIVGEVVVGEVVEIRVVIDIQLILGGVVDFSLNRILTATPSESHSARSLPVRWILVAGGRGVSSGGSEAAVPPGGPGEGSDLMKHRALDALNH
jgi:hypothetical protein